MSSYFLIRNYNISSYEKTEKEAKLDEQNLCGGANYYKSDYIPCSDDESLWQFTVIFNENEYLHKRFVTVMDNFDNGENPAVQSMLVTNENNRTATFEYHMDKDIKADIKLSVYYCKECRIITAEW